MRVGPLVGEHPLYAEVWKLTADLGVEETADLRAAKDFLESPLGLSLWAPQSDERPAPVLSGWEAKANAEREARLEEARQLLESWPRPELSRTRRRLTADRERELRLRSGEAALDAVRAEMRALEERKGRLAELRQAAASDDEAEAALAVDRQVELWREVAAEGEAARRRADEELRALEREYESELARTATKLSDAADEDREQQRRALREGGTTVREAIGPAANRAMSEVDPAANATDAPPPPETESVSELMKHIEHARRAAWERQRERLAAARSRLLRRIDEDTRNAVKAIAVSNGIEVHFDCVDDHELPDATEEFRALLRDHWAARAPRRSQEVALATQ